METAPTSIEVLLRPTLSQSDEPSDLRGSLSPTSVYNTWQSPGGHPSNYEPGATLLNFSDRANHDKRTPYSVYADDSTFITTLHMSYVNINYELSKISNWLKLNMLSINVSKSKFIVFYMPQKGFNIPSLNINNTNIERVTQLNFLGIIIH